MLVMNHWTPQSIACLLLVVTVCGILVMIEVGIFLRSSSGDVAESRTLLSGTIQLVIGLIAGFVLGKKRP